jgi:hypothetical protein
VWQERRRDTSGEYGGTEDIEDLYVPITGTIYLDNVAISLTVPYLSFRAPSGTTVTDPGGMPVPGSGQTIKESGLGDVVAGVTIYDVFLSDDRSVALDLVGRVKLGTADRDKGLGTGEQDFLLRADLYKFFDLFTLIGSGGYKLRGDPSDIDLENGFLASIGGSYEISNESSVGLFYDYFVPFSWRVLVHTAVCARGIQRQQSRLGRRNSRFNQLMRYAGLLAS